VHVCVVSPATVSARGRGAYVSRQRPAAHPHMGGGRPVPIVHRRGPYRGGQGNMRPASRGRPGGGMILAASQVSTLINQAHTRPSGPSPTATCRAQGSSHVPPGCLLGKWSSEARSPRVPVGKMVVGSVMSRPARCSHYGRSKIPRVSNTSPSAKNRALGEATLPRVLHSGERGFPECR
jgi:hypothetical protein